MSELFPQLTSSTAASVLLLTLINFGLYGFLCVQFCIYYTTLLEDSTPLKILVYECFTIETLQTLLLAVDGFDILVTNRGDPFPLDKPHLYWLSITVLNAIVTTAGQLLCAYRLRVILRSWIIPVSIIFLSTCAGVSQIITGARIYLSGSIISASNDGLESALVYFIPNIICNIVMVVCILRYLLYHHPIFNTWPRYHLILKHPIRLLVETGSFIAITQFVCFILYFSGGSLIPYAMMSKLYSNTLLLMLNNRIVIPGGRNDMQLDILVQSWWNPNSAVASDIKSITTRGAGGVGTHDHEATNVTPLQNSD